MNPKEQALDLYKKMHAIIDTPSHFKRKARAKEVAAVTAEEVIDEIGLPVNEYDVKRLDHWQQVIIELKNI